MLERTLNPVECEFDVTTVAQGGQQQSEIDAGQAAQEILPPGYGVDYTGESRQLRTEGNKFLPAFSMAVLLIFRPTGLFGSN